VDHVHAPQQERHIAGEVQENEGGRHSRFPRADMERRVHYLSISLNNSLVAKGLNGAPGTRGAMERCDAPAPTRTRIGP
jgi:hypothetical protein